MLENVWQDVGCHFQLAVGVRVTDILLRWHRIHRII